VGNGKQQQQWPGRQPVLRFFAQAYRHRQV